MKNQMLIYPDSISFTLHHTCMLLLICLVSIVLALFPPLNYVSNGFLRNEYYCKMI